jgi:hypothetical protein
MNDSMQPLNSEQLVAFLCSGEAEIVNSALEILDQAWQERHFISLPMPCPDCLEAFGENIAVETVARYLSIIENYPDFEPTPSSRERRNALLEAVIKYGRGELTYFVALALKVDYDPEYAVTDALNYIQIRGVDSATEVLAVQNLVDYLLDSITTRQFTIAALRIWQMMEFLPEVIEVIMPLLNNSEQIYLNAEES